MGCWAVIPARMGSTRLPGKALADVGGLPLVVHVWRRVAGSGRFARVLVATDDRRILEAVQDRGGEAVLTGAAPSGTHRVALAMGAHEGPVVNVQGDQPLVSVDALSAVVRGLSRAPIATVGAPLVGDPADAALVKLSVQDGLATRFSRVPPPSGDALHHVGIYGFGPGALSRAVAAPPSEGSKREDLEQLAWMDAGLPIAVERIAIAPEGIDTGEQLARLRARFDQGLEQVPDHPDPAVYAASGLR